jgi:hypothetical protein
MVDGPLEVMELLRKGFLDSLLGPFGEDGVVGFVLVDSVVEGGQK